MLADLGAEVIKIERPGVGDDTRHWGPPWHGEGDQRVAAYFLSANRGKKSAAIDFSKPEGAALVRKLAAQSDVVVENFKVGGLKKFGLDAESLRAANPRLIVASITGFGQDGPYAERAGYDYIIQGDGRADEHHRPARRRAGRRTDARRASRSSTCSPASTPPSQSSPRCSGASGAGRARTSTWRCSTPSSPMLANQASNALVSGKDPPRQGNTHPEHRAVPAVPGGR